MYSQDSIRGIINRVLRDKGRPYEVLRFGIVGVIATVVHYGLYLLLLLFLKTNIAYTIGYIISFLINFQLSNRFTFQTRPSWFKGLGFGASHAINYALHIILLNGFIWMGIDRQVAPIPVFAIVIPVNFLLVRYVLRSGS